MRSGRARKRPEPEPPVFFFDRSLGRHEIPAVFRDAGFEVVLMSELYPHGQDQRVPDETWIAEVSRRGWVALTKDAALVRAHREALARSSLRVFALPNAELTGPDMAARFRANLHRIVQRARRPGPFVDIVYPDRVERRWSP